MARERPAPSGVVRAASLAPFVASLPFTVAFLGPDLRYLEVSDRWLARHELERETTIGHRHDALRPTDQPSWWSAALAAASPPSGELPTLPLFVDGWRIELVEGRAGHVVGLLITATQEPSAEGPESAAGLVEAQRAAAAAKRRNRLYEVVFEALPDLIFAKDREGRFILANSATAAVMGADSPEALIGRTDRDFYEPDLVRQFVADEAAFFAQGTPMIVEQPGRRLDGSRGWLCSMKAPLVDDHGAVVGYVGHGRDITEEKRARERIARLSEEATQVRRLLEEATAAMTDGFAIFDRDDRLLVCNELFAQTYGVRSHALLGRTFEELQRLPPLRRALGLSPAEFEAWLILRLEQHRRADGTASSSWLSEEAYLVREHRTREGGVVLARTRITELKRAEEGLRETAERLRAVLDGIVDGIITIDGAGRIESLNSSAARIFGYRVEELRGRDSRLLMPDALPERHERRGAHRRPDPPVILGEEREVEGVRSDGSRVPLAVAVSPLELGDRRSFIVVVRDTSERHRIARLERELISTVSHELRTPLTSIVAALALVTSHGAPPLPARSAQLIEMARRNGERLTRLVNDILDIERLTAGRVEYSMQRLDLQGVVKDCLESNQAFAARHQVQLALDPEPPRVAVRADAYRLQQAVTNILSNAIKFSPPGAVVRVRIELSGARVRVLVIDRGRGISARFRSRIFRRFAQADASDARDKVGSGLGLSITKAIVEQHGGAVGFDSELGRGSTFWLELPTVPLLELA